MKKNIASKRSAVKAVKRVRYADKSRTMEVPKNYKPLYWMIVGDKLIMRFTHVTRLIRHSMISSEI